jgi:hypothetical protein
METDSTAVTGGKGGKKKLIMGVSIYHGWYGRVQVGRHHRMGDKVVQDNGMYTEMVVALEVVPENEWEKA